MITLKLGPLGIYSELCSTQQITDGQNGIYDARRPPWITAINFQCICRALNDTGVTSTFLDLWWLPFMVMEITWGSLYVML